MINGRERGLASVLGLALLLLVTLLGLGLWQLVSSGLQDSSEALQEMRLRLAAESALEKAAVRIEASNGGADGGIEPLELPKEVGKMPPLLLRETCSPEQGEPIEVQVFLVQLKEEPAQQAILEAWAALPRDSWGWQRRKVVRGLLEKEAAKEGETGDYVWKGWLPA